MNIDEIDGNNDKNDIERYGYGWKVHFCWDRG